MAELAIPPDVETHYGIPFQVSVVSQVVENLAVVGAIYYAVLQRQAGFGSFLQPP
jgi:hypothetical protein